MKRYTHCILATCCVPWKQDHSFSEEIFRWQIRHLVKNLTRHIYIFGSAGEGYAVTDTQFKKITEVFCEEMRAAQAEPMVGVISASLPTVVERITWAHSRGVSHYQISLPCWGQCTFEEIRRFFAEICGRFDDCYFMHFNSPHTKRLVTPDEYAVLVGEFPNLVATKNIVDSVCEVTALLEKSGQLQHFFMEHGFALASLLGLEAGWIIAPASCNLETAKLFYRACMERDMEKIAEYTIELVDIQDTLLKLVGGQGHMDGAYDKIYCKLADPEYPLRLLPPYSYVSDESLSQLVAFLRNKYPHWAPTVDGSCCKRV